MRSADKRFMKTPNWKILAALLFFAALAWGLIQRQADPHTDYSKTYSFKKRPAANAGLADYYKTALDFGAKTNNTARTSFFAVGDIMLSRNVAAKIQAGGDPQLPFRQIGTTLQTADFSFGNLESPIVSGPGITGGGSLVFAASSSTLTGLINAKFQVLNLANNHALDQGPNGLESTLNHLNRAGIQHVGAGTSQAAAWQPAKVSANGITTCFLGASYASVNDGGKTSNAYVARIEDAEKLAPAISQLKPGCDFVVVTMHAGTEYTRNPNQAQTDFAHAAIAAGADMVIGAHPHWVQTVEKYQGKYIFYSLGNFIFDQMWSQETREGLMLKVNLVKPGGPSSGLQGPQTPVTLDSVQLLPVVIDDYSTPRLASETEAQKLLESIGLKENLLR